MKKITVLAILLAFAWLPVTGQDQYPITFEGVCGENGGKLKNTNLKPPVGLRFNKKSKEARWIVELWKENIDPDEPLYTVECKGDKQGKNLRCKSKGIEVKVKNTDTITFNGNSCELL